MTNTALTQDIQRIDANCWMETCGELTLFFVTARKTATESATVTVLVDTEDVPRILEAGSLQVQQHPNGFYAYVVTRGRPGEQDSIALPRLILRPRSDEVVDHVFGHTLDHRKKRLRVTTNLGNRADQTQPRSGSRSGFLGVKRVARKWAATFTYRGCEFLFGYFEDAERAAQAYVVGREKVRSGELDHTSVFALGQRRLKAAGCNPAMRQRLRRITIFDAVPTAEEIAQSRCIAGRIKS